MQTTLRIDDEVYREAMAEAARAGMTLTRYNEEALKSYPLTRSAPQDDAISERNRIMEALLRETANLRIGEKPSREEMNER